MDKEAFLSAFTATDRLGGPENAILNVTEAAVLNSPSVLSSSGAIETTEGSNSLFSEASLINQVTPGTKLAAATAGTQEKSYFIAPTTGWNWGSLHSVNAVDIANDCGTPVYAAAEGLITENAISGWNSGYGNYIKIEHPNGAKTLYAHLNQSAASWNQYVFQGDLIGYMGNTGNTHGPTGCHLHFEVRGMANPLAK